MSSFGFVPNSNHEGEKVVTTVKDFIEHEKIGELVNPSIRLLDNLASFIIFGKGDLSTRLRFARYLRGHLGRWKPSRYQIAKFEELLDNGEGEMLELHYLINNSG